MADCAAAVMLPAGYKALAAGLLWSRGAQAMACYRLGRRADRHGLRPVAEALQRASQLLFGIDVSYRADIGPGLALRHGTGTVIGNQVRIGSNVTIFSGVVLGKRLSGSAERPDGMPVIGDGVVIGAGACVLGPVTVGPLSFIGANAVVTKDVPPGCLVTGPSPVYRPGGSPLVAP